VLALLLPVGAQGVALASAVDSLGLQPALNWGSVIVTAVILAVDAALLGRVDLKGVRRASPLVIFLGVLLLWIVCYPAVFFRRRHFGRPNLGPLALLVAVFFIGAPFLHNLEQLVQSLSVISTNTGNPDSSDSTPPSNTNSDFQADPNRVLFGSDVDAATSSPDDLFPESWSFSPSELVSWTLLGIGTAGLFVYGWLFKRWPSTSARRWGGR
jgi:hypothetical protein